MTILDGSLRKLLEKKMLEEKVVVQSACLAQMETEQELSDDGDPANEASWGLLTPAEAVEDASVAPAYVPEFAGDFAGPDVDAEEAAEAANSKIGWVSPRYTVSRHIDLDHRRVEDNRCVAIRSDAPEVEQYRILRTRILQRTAVSGGRTIMITSALPGEGKTLTAINLALTFAREFKQTALLVDCDLKNQQMQNYFGFCGERGLADYLIGDCTIADLVIWPGIEKLTVITGGLTLGESAELLASPRMKALVTEMKDRYPDRYIFFDVPAVLTSADALAFAPLVDHVLLTVRAGKTPMDQVDRAVSMLPREKFLGLVLNGEEKK